MAPKAAYQSSRRAAIKAGTWGKDKEEDVTFSNERIIYPYDKDEILRELEKSPSGTRIEFSSRGTPYYKTIREKDGQKVVKDSWDRDVPIAQGLRYDLDNSNYTNIWYPNKNGRTTEVKEFATFNGRPGSGWDRVIITERRESQIWDNDNPRTATKFQEVQRPIFVYKKIPAGFKRTDVVYVDSKTNNKYRRYRKEENGKGENVYKREL